MVVVELRAFLVVILLSLATPVGLFGTSVASESDTAQVTATILEGPLAGFTGYPEVATDGERLFIFGGRNDGGPDDRIHRFDPTTGVLTTLDHLLPPRPYLHAVAFAQGAFFMIGGNALDSIYRYDPTDDTFVELDATLPTPRRGHTVHAVDGSIWIIGGENSSTYHRDILIFDPQTGTVTDSMMRLPFGLAYHASMVAGQRIYVFGGATSGPEYGVRTIIEIDTAGRDTPQIVGRLPADNYGLSAFTVAGTAILFGGRGDGGSVYDAIYLWNTQTKTLVQNGQTLPEPRYYQGAALIGTDAYALGGFIASRTPATTNHLLRPSGDWPPFVVIQPVGIQECTAGGATFRLDGQNSTDPFGDPLAFKWSAEGVVFDDADAPTTHAWAPFGTTRATLRVSDGVHESVGHVDITVVDTVAPTVELLRPVAGVQYVEDVLEVPAPDGRTRAIGPLTVVAHLYDSCGGASGTIAPSFSGPFTTTAGGGEAHLEFETVLDRPLWDPVEASLSVHASDLGGNTVHASLGYDHLGTEV